MTKQSLIDWLADRDLLNTIDQMVDPEISRQFEFLAEAITELIFREGKLNEVGFSEMIVRDEACLRIRREMSDTLRSLIDLLKGGPRSAYDPHNAGEGVILDDLADNDGIDL